LKVGEKESMHQLLDTNAGKLDVAEKF